MLKSIINTTLSIPAVAFNCTVAAVQTISDEEVKQAFKERNKRIKQAKEQFNLVVKDVYREKLAARYTKKQNNKQFAKNSPRKRVSAARA